MMGVRTEAAEKVAPAPPRGVTVREAMPGDAEGLGRMFSRCSPETIRFRFHLPFPRIPRAMLDRLADVDSRLGKALVAEAGGEVVGHAMYAREDEGDREADVAVVVEDGWGSKGVGRRLLIGVCEEAKRDDVETLLCTTLGDNYRIQDVARRAFPEARITFSGGMCEMRLPLNPLKAAHAFETHGGST